MSQTSQPMFLSQSSYYSPNIGAPKRGRRSFKPAKRSVKTPKGRKMPTAASINAIVKRTVLGTMEKKRIPYISSATLYGLTQTVSIATNNIIGLTPNSFTGKTYTIVQGTGQQNRIGNQISPVKAVLKVNMFAAPYNAVSNTAPRPFTVRMLILSPKPGIQCISCTDLSTIVSTTLFQNGNGTLGALGNLYDLITPYNDDVVTIHFVRDFKLGPAAFTGVTGGADATTTKASNDFSLSQEYTVDVTKYLPKKITFDDNSGQTTSRPTFCLFHPVAFDSVVYGAAQIPCNMVFSFGMDYVDA